MEELENKRNWSVDHIERAVDEQGGRDRVTYTLFHPSGALCELSTHYKSEKEDDANCIDLKNGLYISMLNARNNVEALLKNDFLDMFRMIVDIAEKEESDFLYLHPINSQVMKFVKQNNAAIVPEMASQGFEEESVEMYKLPIVALRQYLE